MLASYPEARSHLATTSNCADMVRQITDINRRVSQADPGADDGCLTVIIQTPVGEAKRRWRHELDRSADKIAANILLDDRSLTDIKRASGGAGWHRFSPTNMDMRLGMPQFVFGGIIAVPAKPPINHRRGHTWHHGKYADPHAAVARQHKAIFEHGFAAEQIARSLVDTRD